MKENFSPVLPAAIAAALNLKPEAEKAPKSCDGISDDKRSDSFWQLTDVTLKPEGKPIEAHSQVLSLHSPVFASMFFMTEVPPQLDDCMKNVPFESMQLLIHYMYSHNPNTFINGLSLVQIEKLVEVADQFSVTHLLEEADSILHGKVALSTAHPMAAMEWILLAERCRCLPQLQARCEAFLAGNFALLKTRPELSKLDREAWMRLMYAAHYTGSTSKETVLREWISGATKGGRPPY